MRDSVDISSTSNLSGGINLTSDHLKHLFDEGVSTLDIIDEVKCAFSDAAGKHM